MGKAALMLLILTARLLLHPHSVGLRNQISLANMGEAHSNNADTLDCLQQTVASVTKFTVRCFSLICLWTGVCCHLLDRHHCPVRTIRSLLFGRVLVFEGFARYSTPLSQAQLSCAARLRQIHRFSCWHKALRGAPQSVQLRCCGC